MSKTQKRFFVSHSSLDEKIVSLFVDDILVKGLRINDDEIYCSSMQGLGNLSGDNFIAEIKNALKPAEISFLMISENYKCSEICLNEMGASWLADCHVIPILIEPVSFQSVGPLNIQTHCEKILDDNSIYNIRKTIKEKCTINPTGDGRWKSIVEKYIEAAQKIKINQPDLKTVTIDKFNSLSKEKEGLQEEINEMVDEIDKKDKYITELESKKDKIDIQKAKKVTGITTYQKILDEKVKDVKHNLGAFSNLVKRMLLRNYYNHPHPKLQFGEEDEINDAISRKYLTEDWESGSKKDNRELEESLVSLGKLEEDEKFCVWYEEEYDDSFDPSDQDFWDEYYF